MERRRSDESIEPKPQRSRRRTLQTGQPVRNGITSAVLVAIMITASINPAYAHSAPSGWMYPTSCCSNQDCEAVHGNGILEGPLGYVVQDTGEIIGYMDVRIKESPDGEFHLCRAKKQPPSRTICLFVPPRSF